ncbi:hypothetical protein [Amycolatopsis magusensis]|uniref:hypothetical protein n=1 Tax=Amycolatopsis magusensis TaxID=882444 RepID=UPI0037939EFB
MEHNAGLTAPKPSITGQRERIAQQDKHIAHLEAELASLRTASALAVQQLLQLRSSYTEVYEEERLVNAARLYELLRSGIREIARQLRTSLPPRDPAALAR